MRRGFQKVNLWKNERVYGKRMRKKRRDEIWKEPEKEQSEKLEENYLPGEKARRELPL